MSLNADFVAMHTVRVRELLADMAKAPAGSQQWIESAAALSVRADRLAKAAEALAAELKEPKA
jgi:hypothetical protein